jgi:large subunit ribosomal protein L24
MFIRVNDIVQVLSGDDKGKRGKVVRIDRANNKVVVQGVGMVYRHMKPSRRNQQGGRLSREMPIDISKVQLICPQTNKPTRIGVRYLADGSKERYAKRSGTSMGRVAPPRAAHAGKA